MSEIKKILLYGLSLIFWVNTLAAMVFTMPVGLHNSLAIFIVCITGIICILRIRDSSFDIYYEPLIVFEVGVFVLAVTEVAREYYSFIEAFIQWCLLAIALGILFYLPQILEIIGQTTDNAFGATCDLCYTHYKHLSKCVVCGRHHCDYCSGERNKCRVCAKKIVFET